MWKEGSGAQASARAAETGRYVQKSGRYTVEIMDGKETFSLKITDDDGNELSIIADLTQESALVNFKVNGESVEFVKVKTNPKKPGDVVIDDSSDDSSDSDDNSDSDDEEDDVTISENLVAIPAASIDGTETWTPESNVFVSGRKLEIASFYMSDHPVTRAEYKAIIKNPPDWMYTAWESNAYDKDGNKLPSDAIGNNPAINISWYDAIVYCNKLSMKKNLTPCYKINNSTNPDDWGDVPEDKVDGNDEIWDAATCDFSANGYRLPTEAEWEWAARGGEKYKYAGSNYINEVAWYVGNTNDTCTRDVKTKNANAYGLYDMSGNVWEWCWDWYNSSSLSSDTPATGEESSNYGTRCMRGGSWHTEKKRHVQIDYRTGFVVNTRYSYLGFRVVRTAK